MAALGLGGVGGHAGGGEADGVAGAGLDDDEVVRGGVGVDEFQLHGLAGLQSA